MKADTVLPSELSAHDVESWSRYNIATPGLAAAFLSYPYVLAAEKVFGNVQVCRLEDGGEPVLFFPFQYGGKLHRLFGAGQRVGGELSDYFGVVAKSGLKLDPSLLLRYCGLNALLFTHLEESQLAFGLKGESPEPGHLVDFPQGGQAFWKERKLLDKKFVSDTERRERMLERDLGPIRFEFKSGRPAQELHRLITAKRDQYKRTHAADPLQAPTVLQFLQTLSELQDPLCEGVLSTLHAGDTWVASHFGLRCKQTLHYWFPAYNPELGSYSPGRLLFKQVVQASDQHGITRIDRGAGDSPAKRDFATAQHAFYRGIWTRPTLQAMGYRLSLSAKWRLGRMANATRRNPD